MREMRYEMLYEMDDIQICPFGVFIKPPSASDETWDLYLASTNLAISYNSPRCFTCLLYAPGDSGDLFLASTKLPVITF